MTNKQIIQNNSSQQIVIKTCRRSYIFEVKFECNISTRILQGGIKYSV